MKMKRSAVLVALLVSAFAMGAYAGEQCCVKKKDAAKQCAKCECAEKCKCTADKKCADACKCSKACTKCKDCKCKAGKKAKGK